ncbi:MAG: hypothetical protein Q4G42_09005 [Neisseria sp.]|nr:hypothetical protein [Neisseria sp.]
MNRVAVYSLMISGIIGLSSCSTAAKKVEMEAEVTPPTEQRTLNIERTVEVAYQCLAEQKKQTVRVMYGIEGDQIVAAQLSAAGKITPILLRDLTGTAGNTFRNGPVTWLALSAAAANVDKVNGNMLTVEGKDTIDGKQITVNRVVFEYCKLDSKTTRRLNKEAAKRRAGSLQEKAVNATL